MRFLLKKKLKINETQKAYNIIAEHLWWMGKDGRYPVAVKRKKIEINWVDIVEILGGKINNEWFLMDSLSLMHQIGAIPYQINV